MLEVVPVQIYGTSESALLHTFAVPNLILARLADHRIRFPMYTQNTITVADVSDQKCFGSLRDV